MLLSRFLRSWSRDVMTKTVGGPWAGQGGWWGLAVGSRQVTPVCQFEVSSRTRKPLGRLLVRCVCALHGPVRSVGVYLFVWVGNWLGCPECQLSLRCLPMRHPFSSNGTIAKYPGLSLYLNGVWYRYTLLFSVVVGTRKANETRSKQQKNKQKYKT